MLGNIAAIANLLSCPNDGESLSYKTDAFVCASCGNHFPIHAANVAEILPERPVALTPTANKVYHSGYITAFKETLRLGEKSLAWGAEESASESWARKRWRQVEMVRPLITEGTVPSESVLCDIAAGAGYYTFAYAKQFRFVLHCDLSATNLDYAWQRAQARNIGNIFFIRMDYFSPPFRHSVNRILCLDTLIRGYAHETSLLKAIEASLPPCGIAVVDFHNWWHNPLRRLGLQPDNFADNKSYAKGQAQQLLSAAGIKQFESFPFYQELKDGGQRQNILMHLLAPTRLLFRFDGAQSNVE